MEGMTERGTRAQVEAAAQAVVQHIQACFAAEATVAAGSTLGELRFSVGASVVWRGICSHCRKHGGPAGKLPVEMWRS